MLHETLFVFDIETIPDTQAVHNLTGFESDDVQELRGEIERYHLDITGGKNAFPRQPFHKVVAISFVEAGIERDGGHEFYRLQEVRSGGEEVSDEETLVRGFFQYFDRKKPRLVSFNGRTFDVPVLKYRAMKYGITSNWLHKSGDKWNCYNSRYSQDWHCDLIDALSDYGASARIKLNEVCSILDLPGKFGVDGSKVTDMFDAGEVAEIRNYCETDVLNTYLVYLHHQNHTGTLTLEGLRRSKQAVVDYLEEHKEKRPYLGEFLEAWRDACAGNFTGE